MWQRRDESQRTAALIERESGFGIVEIHELVIDTRCLQANCKCAPNARNVQVRNANYRLRLWSALDVTIQWPHSMITIAWYYRSAMVTVRWLSFVRRVNHEFCSQLGYSQVDVRLAAISLSNHRAFSSNLS